MNPPPTTLLIDAGNSLTKWRSASHQGQQPSHQPAALRQDWADLAAPTAVLISNVAGEDFAQQLCRLTLELWHLQPRFIHASHHSHGVSNGYSQPQRLGADRWAAMIAARQLYPGALLIADCGTALTLDLLDEQGKHREALILPGLHSMRHSLLRATHIAPHRQPLAADSEQGIRHGCLLAVRAAIETCQREASARLGQTVAILLCGGDAREIGAALPCAAEVCDQLVLDGLALLAQDPG